MLTIDIIEGDITAQDTDAIVNAANNHFWMGGGVAGAIKRRGGQEIEAEAMRQGPVDPGACVITSGGRLAAKHVIHAAVMGQDLQTSASIIGRATRNALALADERGLTSVALPAFGTGVGGFPLEDCARVMVRTVRDHEPRNLEHVVFAVYGEQARAAFERALV